MSESRMRNGKRVEGGRMRITVVGAASLFVIVLITVYVLRNLRTNEPEPAA